MNEQGYDRVRSRIKDVIGSKAWYQIDKDGRFVWQDSVAAIADSLGLQTDVVKEAIEKAFDEASLSRVTLPSVANESQEGGAPKEIPFIEAVAGLCKEGGHELYIWTVGDTDWQNKKINLTGAAKYLETEHLLNAQKDKIQDLREFLLGVSSSWKEGDPKVQVVVVDDKQSNVTQVCNLDKESKMPGVAVKTYHMKLDDLQANADRCYTHIKGIIDANPNDKVVVMLDFDGVVANTDAVLFGKACDNLTQLYLDKTTNIFLEAPNN